MATQIILPSDGLITRDAFAGLPTPSHGWAWELRSIGANLQAGNVLALAGSPRLARVLAAAWPSGGR